VLCRASPGDGYRLFTLKGQKDYIEYFRQKCKEIRVISGTVSWLLGTVAHKDAHIMPDVNIFYPPRCDHSEWVELWKDEFSEDIERDLPESKAISGDMINKFTNASTKVVLGLKSMGYFNAHLHETSKEELEICNFDCRGNAYVELECLECGII